jgi:hypothetical protein
MAIKIDRRLNLVIPIERDDGIAYVHATPISREVFEANYLPISKAFAAIYSQGLGLMAGPRVAALVLKQVSIDLGMWDGPTGVEASLMNEIRRLANVLAPGPGGWQPTPFQEAIDRQMLSPDDAAEVQNALVFFIVASAMHRRTELASVLAGAAQLWGAQIESLTLMEFSASLPTSTETASSGATVTTSSVPY